MSEQIAASVLSIGVDAQNLITGFANIVSAAKQTESAVAQSAQKIDGAVSNAGKAAAKTTESTTAQTRAINQLRSAVAQLTLSEEEYRAYLLKSKGVSDELVQSLVKQYAEAKRLADAKREAAAAAKAEAEALRESQRAQAQAAIAADDFAKRMGMVGVSAGQAKNALRQLPAQFTDIWVSLASGQQPITVFLQQGGQIKDMFGGVGNASRALLSVLTPMRLAIGGAGAAIVGLGMAYKQGSAEADEYRKSLVLTGNAAGTTVNQLAEVAAAVSKNVGTQSQAAAVLAQLAESGKVAAGDMGKLAEAAVRLERVGGPAAAETAKAFAELSKEPSKAVAKLNESTNFLTLSLYKQIKALEEQGKTAEAASLAQTAYADAVSARAKTLEANLGTLEKAWKGITGAAKGAWDAMLNIGRPDTLEEQYAKAKKNLDTLTATAPGARISPDRQRFIEQARQQLEVIAQQVLAQQEQAQAEADLARTTKAGIKAVDEAAEAAKKFAKERDKLIEQGRELVQALDLKDAGFNANFITEMEKINALAAAKALSDESQKRAIAELIEQQPFYTARLKEEEAARKELLKVLKEEDDARSDAQREADKADAAADKRVEQIENETNAIRDQIVELRLGKAAREQAVAARLQDRITGLEAERASIGDDISNPRLLQIQREIAANEKLKQSRIDLASAVTEREAAKEAERAAEAAQREWDRTADSIRSGLTDAFRRAFESGEDFGTAFAKVIEREIKSRIATALAGSLADLGMAGGSSLAAYIGAAAAGTSSGRNNFQTAGNLGSAWSGANNAMSLYGSAAPAANYAAVYSGQAYGTGFGTQQSAMLAAQEAGMVSQAGGSTASGWASSAGWIAAAVLGAMKASSDYSAGFRRDQAKDFANEIGGGGRYIIGSGGVESEWANALSKLGFSDRLADLLSGSTAVSALFGYSKPSIREQGVMGSLGAGDFSGTAYADVTSKVGFVRKLFGGSDKTETVTGAAPEELSRFLDTAAKGIFDKAKEYGEALGLPVAALAGVTKDIKVKLVQAADDTPAEIEKAAKANMDALGEALGGYGDALVAGFADAVKPLAQYGETTVETIERVGSAIVSVNEVLTALGVAAVDASVEGGKAATSLEERFGGRDNMRAAAASYLQNFESEGDRVARITGDITKALKEVGLTMPATREAFDDLVKAQNVMTKSGEDAYVALMSVQEGFASIVEPARSAADILNERKGLEQRLLEVQGNTTALRKLERDALDDSNKALFDQIVALEDVKKLLEEATIAARELAGFKEEFAALDFDLIPDELIAKVAELSGGFSTLTTNLSTYYDEFLTESERGTNSAQSLANALKAVGVEVPNTVAGLQELGRDGFRKLVDEATASGNGGAVAALLKVSGTFAELVPSAEQAAEAMQDVVDALKDAVSEAMQVLVNTVNIAKQAAKDALDTQNAGFDARETRARGTYDAEIARIEAERKRFGDNGTDALRDRIAAEQLAELYRRRKVEEDLIALNAKITEAAAAFEKAMSAVADKIKYKADEVSRLTSLSSLLRGTITALRPIGSEAFDRAQAQQQIRDALEQARTTGKLPKAEDLRNSLSIIQRPSENLFATQADYLRDFNRTLNDVTALSEITDEQLDTAELQLNELEKIRKLMESSQFASGPEADTLKADLAAALEEYSKLTGENLGDALDLFAGFEVGANQALIDKIEADDDVLSRASQRRIEDWNIELDKKQEELKNFLDGLDLRREAADDTLELALDGIEADRKQALKAYETEIARLDKIIEDNQKLVDQALGLNKTASSIDEAIKELKTKLAELAALKDLPKNMTDLAAAIDKLPAGLASAVSQALSGLSINVNVTGAGTTTGTTTSLPVPVITNPGPVTPNPPVLPGDGPATPVTPVTPVTGGYGPNGVWYPGGYDWAANDHTLTGTPGAVTDPSGLGETLRMMLQDEQYSQFRARAIASSTANTMGKAESLMGYLPGTLQALVNQGLLESFAAGGMHTGGLRLVGEEGPELEVTGPARYYSADQTMAMLRDPHRANEALVAEVRQLRAQVAELQSAMVATAANTGKTARQLDRWDGEGLPTERT